ncbi:uncharacterized protein LOC101744657 isoform X2 [Bombyx mori]|uniref:BCAS3 WD40 domain-containing protein n=1 Tax=Bombyx mori TaxID=7091 RepID=A0A8R2R343_BOMMO|nr:uncharacterized protein LOC101744657 isoform X2 [Bombyx mori]
MSAESPRHIRSGGPLVVPPRPPSDRSIIDAVSGFINDVTLSSSSNIDPKDVIQWARFETADINEPTPEGESDSDTSPLLLILGYGSGVQVWLIPPTGDAQEVLSWRQGTVRVLRILPTPQHGDCFASKRPLIALCDSAGPGPSFCALSFISIRGGEQVKRINFKNPILDVLANKRSVVISFSERFAVFDAGTLEDRMSVTTCYPCPCPLGGSAPINPLTLGDRWLAYADKKLNQSKRSSGGCEEGVSSYTATVLHAAKSLSKGLRGLGESVAHSLAGGRSTSQSPSPPNTDIQQPGVVTVLDIEGFNVEEGQDNDEQCDPIVAHFVAHSEAIIALKFDASGMLLVTADRRGHDFHVFRINPHPCGPSLASVHHLYILHRGDTTAKVQDIAISPDSRWTAISTLRGTTHVFAVSPYGGACGVRTHTQPRVVNRLSRFHRSAGLPIHAAATARRSPVGESVPAGAWFPNPRVPPYPQPCTAAPLAQLRPTNLPTHTLTRTSSGRQRLSSVSEDSVRAPLLARARFGPVVAGGATCPGVSGRRGSPVAALYLVAADGSLLHLLLHPKPHSSIPKEKICDESAVELEVEAVSQWRLQRPPAAPDLLAPLPPSNPLLQPLSCRRCADACMSEEERWLSQVEIVTHAGPHRRLWMGPQFVFKTYNFTGSNSSLSEAETVEVESGVARSTPVNMPGVRPLVPVLVDSGSASSLEHSPSDSFRRRSLLAESGRAPSLCDVQLREDLAEAMKEDHGWVRLERRLETEEEEGRGAGVQLTVDPLGCVVRRAAEPAAAAVREVVDPDLHTAPNSDEARFRPVAPAALAHPLRDDLVVRPLPRTTTIPVQTLSADDGLQRFPADFFYDSFAPYIEARETHQRESVNVIERELCGVFPPDRPLTDMTPTPDSKASDISFKSSDANEYKGFVEVGNYVGTRVEKIKKTKSVPTEPSVETKRSAKFEQEDFNEIENVNLKKPVEKNIHKVQHAKKKPDKQAEKNIPEKQVEKRISEKQAERDVYEKHDQLYVSEREVEKRKSEAQSEENIGERQEENAISGRQTENNTVKQTDKIVSEKPAEKSILDKREKARSKKSSPRLSKEIAGVSEKVPSESVETKKDVKQVVKDDSVPGDVEETVTVTVSNKSKSQKTYISKSENEVKDNTKTADDDYMLTEFPPLGAVAPPTIEMDLKYATQDYQDDVKNEDQAWDMLLTENNQPIATVNQIVEVDEPKPKSKKKSKQKKQLDEAQSKSEDDSFVEIHAIEEKQQLSTELVSISTPFEDLETTGTYVSERSKSKKSRSPKSLTPERKSQSKEKIENVHTEVETQSLSRDCKQFDDTSDIEVIPEFTIKAEQKTPVKLENNLKVSHTDENVFVPTRKENATSKQKKNKSLSPYTERRKSTEKFTETEVKDVYVIDSTQEEFPEIQITRGNKSRKKSPQPVEFKNQESDLNFDRPVKSWSSIAASKNTKSEEKENKPISLIQQPNDESNFASTSVSLQDKLIELCKRTDIMVAECDEPSELNFVDEHHSVNRDLPRLESLEFALDDFKLEVMRDSLIEGDADSPLCQINIDSILSNMKETCAFNLIDLEKVPPTQEKGFSFVENDKITTQEVKIDDEPKSDKAEPMEKSSDDDNCSPALSMDSDKDEKKSGSSSAATLLTKQVSKSKKSHKKKK